MHRAFPSTAAFVVLLAAGCVGPATLTGDETTPTQEPAALDVVGPYLGEAWYVTVEGSTAVIEAHARPCAASSNRSSTTTASATCGPSLCTRVHAHRVAPFTFDETARRLISDAGDLAVAVANHAATPSFPCDGGYEAADRLVIRPGGAPLACCGGVPGFARPLPIALDGAGLIVDGHRVEAGATGDVRAEREVASEGGVVHKVITDLRWHVVGKFPVHARPPREDASASGNTTTAATSGNGIASSRTVWMVRIGGNLTRSGPQPTHTETCTRTLAPLWAEANRTIRYHDPSVSVAILHRIRRMDEYRPSMSCGADQHAVILGIGAVRTNGGLRGLEPQWRFAWDGGRLSLDGEPLANGDHRAIAIDQAWTDRDGNAQRYAGTITIDVEDGWRVA